MRGLITFTIAIPFLLGIAGCERAKTKLDREVDRLCAIDGGVHIYQTVTLPKENFGPFGQVFPQYQADVVNGGGLGPDYKWVDSSVDLIKGDPSLTRVEQSIIRLSDKKVLGKRIVYMRGGGDFWGPWAPSGYRCQGVPLSLSQLVFIKENDK